MMRFLPFGVTAVVVLIFVQSTNPIISIHRSSTSKTSCRNTEGLGFDSEDAICHPDDSEYSDGETEKSLFSSAMRWSLASAVVVGLTGIFPLVTIRNVNIGDSKALNRLLSFAVGSMLGDVFLHLLPESWDIPLAEGETFHSRSKRNGLWLMFGLLCFCALEKLFPDENSEEVGVHNSEEPAFQNANGNNNAMGNGEVMAEESDYQQKPENIRTSGYLNLFANFTDNFTHGLAIGGSYLVGHRVGILTTSAILLHEIPHEFGDFAILLRAGFSRWEAAKLQLTTATGGLLGAAFAHLVGSDAAAVAWILPYTSGGFIYIALCTVVPDLVKETTSGRESVVHLFLMILGVAVMGLVGFME